MTVTGAVANAIGTRSSMDDLVRAASRSGYRPMEAAAEAMIEAGKTTRAEADRHVFFSEPDVPMLHLRAA